MGLIRDGHIGYREGLALLTITISSKVFLTCPRNLIGEGQTAGWLVSLVHIVVALVAVLPGLLLLKKYPDLTLIEVAEKAGGAATGILISLLMFFFLSFTLVVILRQFTETVIVALLPTTPISIITLLFILGMVYTCYQGIESLSRGAWLLTPYLLIGLLGVLALMLPKANVDNILPIWGAGFTHVLKEGALKSSMVGEILLINLLNPYLRDRQKINWVVFGSLVIYGVLFTLTVLIYQMVFPYPSATSLGPYPLYNMARLVYFGRFLQRVEAIFVFIWVFSLLAATTAIFYGTVISLARGLKLPVYQPLIFPVAVLIYSLNFLVPNFPAAAWLDAEVLHNYGWIIVFGLPALIWLLSSIRDKGGGNRETQPPEHS